MDKNFPEYAKRITALTKELGGDIPAAMKAFGQLHASTMGTGALGAKEKELIALGIAIGARCDGCIAYHVAGSLRTGATRDEIAETIGVAIMMGGGPSTIYGAEALEALKQYEAVNA